jgi:hypothetical protein
MSISISNLVARKRLKNPNDEVYSNVSLGGLADWHSKYSWPTGPGQAGSPVKNDTNVSMLAFGHDNAHKVSSCIYYMQIKPETKHSYVSGYDTIHSTKGDGEVKFRVRGFRNNSDGYATVNYYHPSDQAAEAANPYSKSVTGVGTTTATAAHFTGLGGTKGGTIGFHMDVKITYYNEAGDVGVTTWNRTQIGQSGAGGGAAASWFEKHPSDLPAGSFQKGHCLVFIQGPQCSSHRWSGSITPVASTFSSWMICHGEQMIASDGVNGAGRPDGYQDYAGSPNRHGKTVSYTNVQ